MFFIKTGAIIAWILVTLGAFNALGGLYVALSFEGETMLEASKRYLGEPNSGSAIDKGLMYITGGVVLGLLVEIAKKNKNY